MMVDGVLFLVWSLGFVFGYCVLLLWVYCVGWSGLRGFAVWVGW